MVAVKTVIAAYGGESQYSMLQCSLDHCLL